MQLRYYLSILHRYWILVVLLPLLVAGISGASLFNQPVRYTASARVMITQTPYQQQATAAHENSSLPDFNLVGSWQSSEFIVDDMPQVITSYALARDVSQWLVQEQHTTTPLDPTSIQANLSASTYHRSVTIVSQADTPALAEAFLAGAIAMVQQHGLGYWNRPSSLGTGLSVAILNPPNNATPIHNTRALIIQTGLRVILAFITAVGVSFLLSYLDTLVRDTHQAEMWVGVPVIGEIPKE